MASAAEVGLSPRFGFAADLAVHAGLNVNMVRRLVDAGKIRDRKKWAAGR